MSRRRIPGLDPAHEVYVGWDRPLMTFFGQVYDPTLGEDENPIHWIGADRPRQLPELDALVRGMSRFATIDAAMCATLLRDKDEGR